MKTVKKKWDDAKREAEIRRMSAELGHFPSNQKLNEMGRSDLANQLSKSGGFLYWSERIGVPRQHSDSDTGWDGELAFCRLAEAQGFATRRSFEVKAPFDVLIDDVFRVDVKAARYAEYASSKGWFYRIAKIPQSDLILLIQLDTLNFYGLPWWMCPTTNITISRSGGKWAQYKNNWPLIRDMIDVRKAEKFRIESGLQLAA